MNASNSAPIPRPLLPSLTRGQPSPGMTEWSKPKQVKSRDGCTTCKAKRRKCDEAKPNCSQCLRRKITCGGYSKELTWRYEGFENPLGPKPATAGTKRGKKRSADGTPSVHKLHTPSSGQMMEAANETPVSELPDDPTSERNSGSQQNGDDVSPSFHIPALGNDHDTTGIEPDMDFDVFFSDLTSMMAFPGDLTLDSGQVPDGGEHDIPPVPGFPNLRDAYAEGSPPQRRPRSPNTDQGFSNGTLDASEYPFDTLPKQGLLNWYHPLNVSEDSPETIASVFNHRICEVLCIVDNSTDNPWRQIVWPLAQKHIPLYHAIAAMTCFSGMPRLRAEGFRHLETSMQKLSICQATNGSNSMPLEVMATTLLALAMAKTWYYPRSYNGIAHLKKARGLIQALCRNSPTSAQTTGSSTSSRVRFLMNTWMYMDVLTRITSPSSDDHPEDIIVDYTSTTSALPSDSESDTKTHIDPLMGCANTLFPLIGRVADLVGHVRQSPQKTSSPTMVSTAVELLIAIDNWTPSLVMDDSSSNLSSELHRETITSNFSDLYQTANAYKWATLLLLYQAVPELPSRFSHADIARKILVFIATVPLSSKAVFFPIFPLMVAGCEAADAEDREWVKKRWRSLSTLNGSGIADRCLELTIEVWRRRDEYNTQTVESYAYSVSAGELRPVSTPAYAQSGRGPNLGNAAGPNAYMQHSVRSELHWLSVMKDWGWEVMLG
ncbi:Zn(II)2Cys6 transcription factor [Aspergillus stella-maris]|uniref:Zn(II)2Cys6 transcription factor n=1 Tax=Aspergillus stella-maris TaxID=1810926 RepID=UPI003CCD6DB1